MKSVTAPVRHTRAGVTLWARTSSSTHSGIAVCGISSSHRHDLVSVSAGSDCDDTLRHRLHDCLVLGFVLVAIVNVGNAALYVIGDAVHGVTPETKRCHS